jgi:hypothetical protein
MTHGSPRYYWLNETRMDEEFPFLEMVPAQRESPASDPEQTQRFIETITRKLKKRHPNWIEGKYNNLNQEGSHAIHFDSGEFPTKVEYDGPVPCGI